MEQALTLIYCQYSKGYRHNYQRRLQILDVDMSGLPCGPKAALATKGYFANQRNRRGRQLGRVITTRYGEIVSEQAKATQVKHILGAAAHAARAAELVAGGDERVGAQHIEQARQRATPELVAVLKRYPAAPPGGNRMAQLMSVLDTALRSR